MPVPWFLRGLRDGILTSRWPSGPDEYFDGFRGAVAVASSDDNAPARAALVDGDELSSICPSGALSGRRGPDGAGDIVLDRGRCILCGHCVVTAPDIFTWKPGSAVAALRREQLIVDTSTVDGGSEEEVAALRAELSRRVRRLRRSVHLRHVDAGSDGSDEWEVQALLNPVYDIHRLGIFFTASPRHADILIVTGIGSSGMAAPLRRTREAMPDPVVVIAAGTDAVSGGLFEDGYSGGTGIGDLVDVDIWVPGSPPSPFSLLHAILLALDRLAARRPSEAGKLPGGREGVA
jgi:Ni,Fe-hydrogenase III small subunit/ferredoxin